MNELIEKLKAYFGDKYQFTWGTVWFMAKVPAERSNLEPVEYYKVDLLQANYYDGYGKLDEYLKTIK